MAGIVNPYNEGFVLERRGRSRGLQPDYSKLHTRIGLLWSIDRKDKDDVHIPHVRYLLYSFPHVLRIPS